METSFNCSTAIFQLGKRILYQVRMDLFICNFIALLKIFSKRSFKEGKNILQNFSRLLLPHFGLSEDETKILSGFPMNKINILQSLEKEGERTL